MKSAHYQIDVYTKAGLVETSEFFGWRWQAREMAESLSSPGSTAKIRFVHYLGDEPCNCDPTARPTEASE